jgi:DNA-binding response OmpR family regulator
MRVLIADADWRFSQQASRFLESLAHLVVCQAQCDGLLERVRHWRPDLIILDAELAAEGLLGSLAKLSPRPAVLLTGWMDRCDRVWRAWQQGGDELLMKPVFRSADLLEAIVVALENATVSTRSAPTAASA